MTAPDARFLSDFNFEVLLTPIALQAGTRIMSASFAEVSGLEIQLEATALREGGYNWGQRQLISRTSQPPLVLRRGMTDDLDFWLWIQDCLAGHYPLPYVNGEIHVFDRRRSADVAPAVFAFRHAIATKVRGPDLNAVGSNKVPIEELSLAHESLLRRPRTTRTS